MGSGFVYKTVPHVTLKIHRQQRAAATHGDALRSAAGGQQQGARHAARSRSRRCRRRWCKPLDEIDETAIEPQPADASIARSRRDAAPGRMARRAAEDRHPRQGRPAHPLRPRRAAGRHALAARRRRDGQRRGDDSVRKARPQPQRVVVSFGPEHAPLEQRQVELALEEAQTLVPKPKLIVFAAFQFDPEAAKDIDETELAGRDAAQGPDERRPADRRPEEEAGQQRELLADRPARRASCERIAKGERQGQVPGRGPRLRLLQHQDRRRSSRAARTRSPSGCSTPTTTAAASSRARSSSRWPARRRAGRGWRRT